MYHMSLDLQTQATLSSLANRLNMSEEEVLKEAINNYAKEVHQKENVMEMAGIEEEERHTLLEQL